MIKLSQRDPRWGNKTIGNSKSLIKDYGCTITCIAMASDWFGCYQRPDWLAKNLKFLVDKVIWSSIEKVLCFRFKYRYYKHDAKAFAEAISKPNMVCLLNVYNRHWVLATRKLWGGYWTIDPWTGSSKFYANSSISGGATLIK